MAQKIQFKRFAVMLVKWFFFENMPLKLSLVKDDFLGVKVVFGSNCFYNIGTSGHV